MKRRLAKKHDEGSHVLAPQHQRDAGVIEQPEREAGSPVHANLLRLQGLVGNWQTQRLLEGRFKHAAGLVQKQPEQEPPTATAPTPEAAPAGPSEAAGNTPEEINIEAGMYVGNAEFHAKALPKNQHYAERPPAPGWPYTDALKQLWTGGRHDDFADEVAGFQFFTLKLPEGQVDGVLGPQTTRRLQEKNPPAAPATATPGVEAPSTEEAGPVAGPAAPEREPAAGPAASAETESVAAGGVPAAGDPAVTSHPAALRILAPVEQAFEKYKVAAAAYEAANREMEKAKQPAKAAKEEERQEKLNEMEQERNQARGVMAAAREQVTALGAAEFSGREAELKRVKGYINQALNAHTVYYTQMSNANILSGQGHAAALRTCNMTVVSMMLEALGKSTKDYSGDLAQLQSVAGEFAEQLGVNNANPGALTSLRLPDFLQLVAIQVAGSRDKAADSITSHKFITDVLRTFGLRLTEMKGEQSSVRKEATSFLSTKFTAKLDTLGALYKPAYSDALKQLKKDDTYKTLKGQEKKTYMEQKIKAVAEEHRLKYVANVEAWIDIDTKTREQIVALQSELGKLDPNDASQPRPFDPELQGKADEVIAGLGEISAGISSKESKGKQKQLQALIKVLQKARAADAKKAGAAPKQLKALFDGKGKDDPLTGIDTNLKKYEGLKGLYDKLGEAGGIEELVPLEQYKTSVIQTMVDAIGAGNQVMVNLENHFVRLQSVSDEGFVIDDPGNRGGEDNKITWERGREFGYFQHYLLVSP